MLTKIDLNSQNNCEKVKIHFNITKKVSFGKAVYVVGDVDSLGVWSLASAFRLSWNQGDQWSGTLSIDKKIYDKIEFKYAVSNWDSPSNDNCQWEEGFRNRKLSLDTQRTSVVCNHKWSLDKITLILIMNQSVQNTQYYIIGNIPQLGSWKSKRKMNYVRIRDSSIEKSMNRKGIARSKCQTAFTYTFFINRNRKNIRYYYIKKGDEVQAQRHPGRLLDLSNLGAKRHPDCHTISFETGDIQVIQTCKFNQLNFSKITQQIFVGAYLRTPQDFEQLKAKNINTVFSIQSKQDYTSHCLSPDYLKALCRQNQIQYHSYSIKDMHAGDFIEKCLGAFLILRDLLANEQNRVYVHCSAGMYRSPQIIIVYLVLVNGYGLDEAIEMVTQKHPFAKPNYNLLSQALNQIGRRMSRLIIQS